MIWVPRLSRGMTLDPYIEAYLTNLSLGPKNISAEGQVISPIPEKDIKEHSMAINIGTFSLLLYILEDQYLLIDEFYHKKEVIHIIHRIMQCLVFRQA